MEQITMVQLDQLHPHEKNPRIDAATVADLVESIREHGIEVPLVATPTTEATGYVVLAGHRRLTASHELALAEVPVQIRPDLTDARDQLAFMATENIHRDDLTAVEESRLVQDMLDLGMTQAQVAKQTALGKKRVSERLKLGKLAEQTGDKVHRGQITVEDALIIAEYSDDPESSEQLEEAAGTYNFDWAVSRAKQRREQAAMIEDAKKLAKKNGLRLVDADADFVGLADLLTDVGWSTPALDAMAQDESSGQEWDDLVRAEHEKCPGHSARIIEYGMQRGSLQLGCDQVEAEHAGAVVTEAAPEPADPWDEITAEDFDAARIHREQHLATHLPDLDAKSTALDLVTEQLLGQCWREYGDSPDAIAFIEALTGVEGKSRVRRKLATWDLSHLVLLNAQWWELTNHHRYMAEGRQGSSYWGEKSKLRHLLEDTGYEWTEPEQRAILLATGIPHDASDATDDTDAGAALAEGGEVA
ncbi:MAG: ParB/RepB/Spo0J family partition protein [Brachybacterium tyrofermentans]|uniref:ParB/RepB/Spo0J family partition protein n=1 Tax=Brachybacterium tyrofermentans TaxID=47848 RepID=UPI003F8DE791